MHWRCFYWETKLLLCVFTWDRHLLLCRTDIFHLRVMASPWERHLSLRAVEHLRHIVSSGWTNIFYSEQWCRSVSVQTLMQQQLLQLQEPYLSDWVRVPLTFSHFTETVLKRPSQSPDFMAMPSQGPTDLMDITRINQTFMPTHSSTVGDEAWLCVEGWHDSKEGVCVC